MGFIPAFDLGLWNAWILVIPMLIVLFSDMKATASRETGKGKDFQLTKKEEAIANAVFLPMVVSWVYAILLPLKLGTTWLFGGLAVFLFGIIFTITAVINFATSPKDKIINKGLYRFTRNPTYIGMILMQFGITIACASWLYFLLTSTLLIMLNAILPSEERYCFYNYGEDYLEYKNKTPRWIGIPKSQESDLI